MGVVARLLVLIVPQFVVVLVAQLVVVVVADLVVATASEQKNTANIMYNNSWENSLQCLL